MGAARAYQKRFKHQAGRRLERSFAPTQEAETPPDFLEILREADRRQEQESESDPTTETA